MAGRRVVLLAGDDVAVLPGRSLMLDAWSDKAEVIQGQRYVTP